ncbi:MAG: AtzE family amidohydrolase [Pirellula sp.]
MDVTKSYSAVTLAERIRRREFTAQSVVESVLQNIDRYNSHYVCFTRVFSEQALADAKEIDRRIQSGSDPGVFAGVPFGAKDLFDIAGYPTTAGSRIRSNVYPAKQDAEAVARLKRAGAILIGTLNMDEFAYGFATVNPHFGTTKNPHDLKRLAGGSSGGSAAAVASGLVPISLGSDTNGSLRVPASLCGVWSIRPADSAIPMDGVFPFVEILDTVGPFARNVADLVNAYEILAGSKLRRVDQAPRITRLGGWFVRNASSDALQAVDTVMNHLGATTTVELIEAEAARSASFLITAAQGGALHFDSLKKQAMGYDPAVRDRLLAGNLLPVGTYLKALAFRKSFRKRVNELLQRYDVLIAAATPVVAPEIDQATMMIDGRPAPARANLGLYTQPLSLAGIPVVSAPLNRPNELPIGLQFATAPGREKMVFEMLAKLEYDGVLKSNPPPDCLAG